MSDHPNIPDKGKAHIPWEDFDEEETQLILQGLFETTGYEVHMAHMADRANERGADMLASKKGLTVAIAVKKKPTKKDIYQLIEFSQRPERKKVYVYASHPTNEFKQKEGEFKKAVEFWGPQKLTKEFFKRNSYYGANLVISNTKLFRTLLKIQTILKQEVRQIVYPDGQAVKDADLKRIQFVPPSGADWKRYLWRLKDIGVVLYQVNRAFGYFLDGLPSKLPMAECMVILENYITMLNYIEGEASYAPLFLTEFLGKNKEFMRYAISQTRLRSNWLHMGRFESITAGVETDYAFGVLSKQRQQTKKFRESIKKSELRGIRHSGKPERNPIIEAIKNNTSTLIDFGWSIEATIDSFFELATSEDKRCPLENPVQEA